MEEEKERMRRNSGKIDNKNVNIRNFRVVHTLDFSPFLKNFLNCLKLHFNLFLNLLQNVSFKDS